MVDEPANLVLLHLQGLRREMAPMLERQVRERELITRIYTDLMAFRSETRDEIDKVRRDIQEIKGDLFSLENQMQNRHNEILSIIRRLDTLGAEPG
jgi:uncharacterized coiled-coil DUF342 family protein